MYIYIYVLYFLNYIIIYIYIYLLKIFKSPVPEKSLTNEVPLEPEMDNLGTHNLRHSHLSNPQPLSKEDV